MPRFNPKTKNGHSMYTMRSLLQKAIRRGDLDYAGYAADELFGKYHAYLWRTLLTISAEDCYGIMTKELIALYKADEIANKGRKGYDRGNIFVAKAIVLLCMARKNRDACYVACNFMNPQRTLDIDEIDAKELDYYEEKLSKDLNIPAYTFDIHTLEGRIKGKTDLDMTIDEENALYPHEYNLFDNASWGNYYDEEIKRGRIDEKQQEAIKEFQKGRENDPTHHGEIWPTK